MWLMQVSDPARVATYAYVNPVVAVLLGWGFAGESLSARTFIATGIIVTAVAFITRAQVKRSTSDAETVSPNAAESVESNRSESRDIVASAAACASSCD
jgi:hypothetical protein